MKALFLLAMSLPLFLKAQSLPNTNFENWYIVNYDMLTTWRTSNEITVPQFGVPNVTRINQGAANSSLKLSTIAVGLDTIVGLITNALDFNGGEGGKPYSQKPTGLQGDFRYNIAPHDTARIVVSFKNSGVVFATDMITIWGTQSSFSQKNFPLPVMTFCGLTPDSVIVSVASGDFLNSPVVGSYIEIDNLVFTGSGITQGINGDFDNWQSKSFVELIDWGPSGSVFQTADAFSGSYAAKLISKNDGIVIEPAAIHQNFVSSKAVDTLIGWYKYSSKTPDSASIEIHLLNFNDPPTTITQYLPAETNYTQFSIPLVGATSSTVMGKVVIQSSPWSATMGDSSTLYIDCLAIKPQAVSVREVVIKNVAGVYPNPATDMLTISLDKNTGTEVGISIYNSLGAEVYAGRIVTQNGEAAIPVKQLAAGLYIYEVTQSPNTYKGRFIKE